MHPLIQLRKAIPVFLVGLTLACFTLSPSVVAFRSEAHAKASYKALTFAERVAYQRAIEEVYWRHRIWPKENPDPKPSLDAVMSQAQLENRVTGYLRDSLALEDNWQKPITAEQLQAEINRMARDTKQPEVLRELFEALGNDPAVIAECLARPTLAERLITDLSVQRQTRWSESPQTDSLATMSVAATLGQVAYTLPKIADAGDPPCDDPWTATTTVNAPSARYAHTAVWTGSEMIVWGGKGDGGLLYTGGTYNPSTDSWTATSSTNAPTARALHTAVWTGSEMIVWAGEQVINHDYLNTGGRYNPATNSWIATSTTNAPTARSGHTAIWTGSEMIVWGGGNRTEHVNTGGRYNPATNSWTATSTTNAPTARAGPRAIWTGSEMIVWGGQDTNIHNVNTGGRYNPSADTWTATSTSNAPIGRTGHTAVWTGSEMIVWGGNDQSFNATNTGGRYDPATNNWIATSTTNAPSARYFHTTVWTGDQMIVWGGYGELGNVNTGGRYNPATNSWIATSTTNAAPTARYWHTAVWTSSEMIVWGGTPDRINALPTGGKYCAQSGPTPTPTPPVVSPYDFNHDSKPDFVLLNPGTRQRAVWYMNNNVRIGGAYTPSLPVGWSLIDVADFNRDLNNDYALFNASTGQTALWYLSGLVRIGGHYGPALPNGWALVATGDFNIDGRPDYVLFKASTGQTAIWYLNDNVYIGADFGPSIPAPWTLAGIADFNRDGKPDYLLFNPSTLYSVIWYLSGPSRIGSTFGPTIAAGYNLVGAADFNADARPDYVLFNPSTRGTTLWYMDNNIRIGRPAGPTLPAGWILALPEAGTTEPASQARIAFAEDAGLPAAQQVERAVPSDGPAAIDLGTSRST